MNRNLYYFHMGEGEETPVRGRQTERAPPIIQLCFAISTQISIHLLVYHSNRLHIDEACHRSFFSSSLLSLSAVCEINEREKKLCSDDANIHSSSSPQRFTMHFRRTYKILQNKKSAPPKTENTIPQINRKL